MQIDTILSPERTLCSVSGSSKKSVLETVAESISKDIEVINSDELFDSLIAREKLGSTGLGNGIAIPHCRIKNCQHITGALITLENPVDFDAIDGEPVDLLFVLLVPEQAHEDHLNVLAELAARFSDSGFCQRLRDSNSNESLFHSATSSF